jgi:hypothetical protein
MECEDISALLPHVEASIKGLHQLQLGGEAGRVHAYADNCLYAREAHLMKNRKHLYEDSERL